MSNRLRRIGVLFTGLALATFQAQAHHSPVMFDGEKVMNMSGTVKKFEWTNPHSYVELEVTNAAGEIQTWSLEMGSNIYLYNLGLRPSSLKPGDALTVIAVPLRSGAKGALLLQATTADGKTFGGNP